MLEIYTIANKKEQLRGTNVKFCNPAVKYETHASGQVFWSLEVILLFFGVILH